MEHTRKTSEKPDKTIGDLRPDYFPFLFCCSHKPHSQQYINQTWENNISYVHKIMYKLEKDE